MHLHTFEHAYLYVCVLHQVVLKVRAEPQGDIQAHVHLAPLCPPVRLSPFIRKRVNEICHHLVLRLLWVGSFLCQVKIIEQFHGRIWPLGTSGFLDGWFVFIADSPGAMCRMEGKTERKWLWLLVCGQECRHLLRILVLPAKIHAENMSVFSSLFCLNYRTFLLLIAEITVSKRLQQRHKKGQPAHDMLLISNLSDVSC